MHRTMHRTNAPLLFPKPALLYPIIFFNHLQSLVSIGAKGGSGDALVSKAPDVVPSTAVEQALELREAAQ